MTQPYANIEGNALVKVVLHVPNIGPWWADCRFAESPDVEGAVTLNIGELALSGTIRESGTFGLQRRARVVAGAGGWGALVEALHYHNDAAVSAQTVAQDVARLVGETLSASFAPAQTTIGIDYVRRAGPASRILEDVIGAVPWYVDYDGQTVVGQRTSAEADRDAYEVLDFDPREGLITLGVNDLNAVVVGSIISERLDAPVTLTELRVEVEPEGVRVLGFSGSLVSRGRLAGLLSSIAQKATSAPLLGLYKYRVVGMSGDRVRLQAVVAARGLADAANISMWPGVAGTHGDLTPGAEVLLQFIAGDPTEPVITHFAGKDGNGWTPANLTLDATTLIKLGEGATDEVGLSSPIDSQLDDLNAAMDAFVTATPGSMDGGLALQTAVKTSWGTGVPPKPASDVGADKVQAE